MTNDDIALQKFNFTNCAEKIIIKSITDDSSEFIKFFIPILQSLETENFNKLFNAVNRINTDINSN